MALSLEDRKRVAVFTGTRAEYGLLFWLLKDIQSDPELELKLIASGMHFSPEFGETFRDIEKDGFKIDEKIETLLSSDSGVGVAKSVGLGVLGCADAISRLLPDVIVILGDRFEALAVAQSAMFLRVPIIHIHGGEVTEAAYDDAIRHAITKFSYLHATSTEGHRRRVIQLGEAPERVVNVGAIGLDHLKRSKFFTRHELSESINLDLSRAYFVVTYHPVTLGDEPGLSTFNEIIAALEAFPDYNVIITYPNADDGARGIIPLIDSYAKHNPQRVLAVSSLGQIRYLSAVKHACAVIGNSSSGIIEVPSFQLPTVNVGMRQRGRLAAKSVLNASPDRLSIESAIHKAVNREYPGAREAVQNPYGSGDTSQKVISMIKSLDTKVAKTFYDIKYKLSE